MDDKKNEVENIINLDTSVSEQISDMQLQRLREKSFNRDLSFDEIKTLEILTKVKNAEIEKRAPKDQDPKKLKQAELKKLAESTTITLVKSNETEKDNKAGS